MIRLFSLALLAAIAAPALAQPALPSQAIGFLHVRAADIWQHDMLKSMRDTVAAAGPKALAAFQEQMYPNPTDLDHATVIVMPSTDKLEAVVVMAFKKPVDGEKVRKLYLPEAAASDLGGHKYFIDKDKDIGLSFPDATTLVAGSAKSMESYLTSVPGTVNPLVPLLVAAKAKAVTIGVNVKALPIPAQAYEQIPPDVRPLALMKTALFTIDLSVPDPLLELKATYADNAAAVDAEKAFQAAIAMGKNALNQQKPEMEAKLYAKAGKGPQPINQAMEAAMGLLALGSINRLQAEMDRLPITRTGTDMVAKVAIPKEVAPVVGIYSAGMAAVLMPAVGKVRMIAGSSKSANNMKQMGLAFHTYADANGKMPGAAICDANGKPLLSWRVTLLPYMEQDSLYRQFKLDEPWDSASNKPLIEKMPKLYVDPRVATKPGETVYKVFVGKDAILDWTQGKDFPAITDGSSNTILAIEGGAGVVWTKPEELEFDAAKPLPKLDLPGGLKVINVLMADGSVRRIDLGKVSEKTLKIAIGASDGEPLPPDWDGESGQAENVGRATATSKSPAIPEPPKPLQKP